MPSKPDGGGPAIQQIGDLCKRPKRIPFSPGMYLASVNFGPSSQGENRISIRLAPSGSRSGSMGDEVQSSGTGGGSGGGNDFKMRRTRVTGVLWRCQTRRRWTKLTP